MKRYIVFEVGGSAYGIESDQVRHIEMMEHVTVVPNANPAIDGVVFSRGQLIPALNLRTRFGLPRAAQSLRTRLVFTQIQDRVVALIVDSAREFIAIDEKSIQPIEETLTGIDGNYLKAVAKVGERLILLVDLGAILDVDQYQPAPSDSPAGATVSERAS